HLHGGPHPDSAETARPADRTSGAAGSPAAAAPCAPIPETQTQTGSGQQSFVATRLAANENTGFFLGMVKPQPGDISIVENAGTFLMWHDTCRRAQLTDADDW